MNVSAVSANPVDQSDLAKRHQDFIALQSALQSGNVSSAQGAFAAFLQQVQTTAAKAGPNSIFSPGTQPSKDLAALGDALKSANLTAAQTAFAALAQDIQTAWQPANGDPIAVAPPHHHLALPHAAQFAANSGKTANTEAVGKILNLQA